MGLTRLFEPVRKEIPHEPGEWMEFRKLSWPKVKKARKLEAKESREVIKDLGAEIIKAYASDDEKDKEGAKKLIEDRRFEPDQFETTALLVPGVASWSYDAKVSRETIEDLDEQTAEWAKREVIALTKPPSKEEQKNSAAVSSMPSKETASSQKSG